MQICKNKHSGRYFIYLYDGLDKGKAYFITPDAKEILLRIDLFEDM